MAINPQVVMPQIQGVQLENPMVFAKNALAMKQAQSEIAANELAARRAAQLSGMVSSSAQPGANKLTPQALIAAGFFKEAADLQEAENKLLAGQKSGFDVVGAAMDTSARLLDTVRSPEDMMAWHEANHADPVLGPYLAARGITAEQSRAKIAAAAQDPVEFQQLLLDSRLGLKTSREQHFVNQDLGGQTRVLSMGKYGGPAREVEGSRATVTASPNRPVTQVNVTPGAKKFAETFGEKAATQFDDLYTKAQSAETGLGLSIRLKPLLDNPKFISGTLGNARLAVAKALDLAGAEETQAYFSGIAGQVAENIKNFGAGTGLSDKDREFAENMSGGSIELTPAAIKRIVDLNDKAARAVIQKYNTRRTQLSSKDQEIADYYPEIGAPKSVARTGTLNGRRVVEYSDGSIAYGD